MARFMLKKDNVSGRTCLPTGQTFSSLSDNLSMYTNRQIMCQDELSA